MTYCVCLVKRQSPSISIMKNRLYVWVFPNHHKSGNSHQCPLPPSCGTSNTWLVLLASEKITTAIQIHGYRTPSRQFLGNDEVVQLPGLGQVLPYPFLIWASAWIARKHDLLSCIMKSQAQEACHPSPRGSQQLPALLPRWRDLEDYYPTSTEPVLHVGISYW